MSLFKSFTGINGALHKLDLTSFPFNPEEIFLISGVPVGQIRGKHAHLKCRQLLVLFEGHVKVSVASRGGVWDTHELKTPGDHYLLEPGFWGEQLFLEKDSTLIVFSSMKFDESDYIRNEDDFFIRN